MWGITHNPWKIGISPGGSSGGSAAALSAGAATIATGSDSTGSIRQPASQCGVVGYQPPHGRIPNIGTSSFNGYAKSGPMTRTVEDCAIMANVMSGQDYRDHNSFIEPVLIKLSNQNLAGMKIAFSMDLGCYEISEDVRRETNEALRALRHAGATVDEVPVTWAGGLIDLALGNQEVLFAAFLNENVKKNGDIVSNYVPQLVETANSYSTGVYHQSLLAAGQVWSEHLGPLFQKYDAFITPTTTYTDIPAAGWQKDTVNVNGKEYTDTDTTMAVLWNMYNKCPVIAIPSGRASSGVPTGIQVIGRPYDDQTVFRIAKAFENEKPWLDCAERRPVLASKLS
jgi:amidase